MYEKPSLVKHLAMRRTLWLVDAAHLPMLQSTASDRVADNEERRFGPASPDDIEWWLGSTVTAVRHALRDVDAVEVDLHGMPGYGLPDDLEPKTAAEPWTALLPGLDMTTMGWSRRDWYLGEHRGQVFDRNGNAGPTAWCNGQVVGGWSQDAEGRVHVQLLQDTGRAARQALQRHAHDLTEWLDGVRVSPRFPPPLSKTVAG